jgi:hypothetical protein
MDNFIYKIYSLTTQHLAYIRRLDAACKSGQPFVHKTERECEFGRLLYGEVMPEFDQLPEDIRPIVLEVERLHKDFHAKAKTITCPYEKADMDGLHRITDFLIINLTKLDKKAKAHGDTPHVGAAI